MDGDVSVAKRFGILTKNFQSLVSEAIQPSVREDNAFTAKFSVFCCSQRHLSLGPLYDWFLP